MERQTANGNMIAKLIFRLLPIQILLCLIGSINNIVSSLFASNYVGETAMSAVGLFSPISMFIGAVSTMFVGGASILCGKYMGKDQVESTQNVFSLVNCIALIVSAVFAMIMVIFGAFDLTGFLAKDPAVRPLFNQYLLGQAIGVIPQMLGNLLAAFLSLENRVRRTTTASIIYIGVNVVLNFLFVKVMKLEAFGLALASALGLWVFFILEALYFFSKEANLHFSVGHLQWRDSGEIVRIGVPGAMSYGYQTLRGFIVNALITAFVGSVGLSAFTAANTLLTFVWALPGGMLAVSRMLISISVGEEDRQTLTDVMRNMFFRFLPLQAVISALIIICAVPLTRLYYQDASSPVFMMTVWGFRILPLCMPLSIICMHFTCYGQTSNKQGLVHVLALLDGVVCVAGFTAILIPWLGMNSVYIANVLNGVVTTVVIIGYSILKKRHWPGNMDELMVIPENFGAPESERMDLSLKSMEEVVNISQRIQSFCLKKGIDRRRAYLAGLSMEEMAGNIVDHGFTKDSKKHTVDVRVVHKDDSLILRLKDDCVPFDPAERQRVVDPDDEMKNVGIRMTYEMAEDISYQNILGLNVLTIRI